MIRVTEYKDVEISVDSDGRFCATMADERLHETTLEALKKKITTRVDGGRKYAVPVWLLRITGTDWDDDDEPKVTIERLVFAGVSFHTGQLRFKDPESGKAVKVQDRYSYRDEGYQLVLPRVLLTDQELADGEAGQTENDVLDEIRGALDQLAAAKEAISEALIPLRATGEELKSHYQPNIEKEEDLAEKLKGAKS